MTTFTLLSTTFLMLGLIFAPSMESAMAGTIIHHGLGAQKGCLKVLVDDNMNCEITVTNEDDAGDSVSITNVCDTLNEGEANEETICMAPGASNGFSILSVNTGAVDAICANGDTELPCTLPGLAGDDLDGAVVVFASTGFVMDEPGFIDDDAVVVWNDVCNASDEQEPPLPCNDGEQTSDAPASTLVANPDISVTKDPHEGKTTVGDTIFVRAVVTNSGDETLVNVRANDTHAGELVCEDDTLPSMDSTVCTGEFEAEESGENTVTAFGDFQDATLEDEADRPFTVVGTPALSVEKVCNPATQSAPGIITWEIWVENTGTVELDVLIDDSRFGVIFDGTIPVAGSFHDEITESDLPVGTYVNTVTATADFQLEDIEESDSATCTVTGGSEGLTPGYWKANAEKWDAGAWVSEDPEDDFNDRFGTDVELKLAKGNSDTSKGTSDDPTLYGALGARGGDENALARHCVAAKLNAEHPDVDYPMGIDAVIAQCAEALNNGTPEEINDLKDLLDEQNNLGADISQHWPN